MTDTLRQRKVLIVDDERDWREILSELYVDEGIEIVTVGSLGEAKKALIEGGFTEVLTDGLEG